MANDHSPQSLEDEPDLFRAELVRAMRAIPKNEAIEAAEEALPLDNEALDLAEHASAS